MKNKPILSDYIAAHYRCKLFYYKYIAYKAKLNININLRIWYC